MEFKSPPYPYIAGMPVDVSLASLPVKGPNGGWVVVDQIEIIIKGQITTPANTAMAAQDFATLVKYLRIFEGESLPDRMNLSGFWLRQYAFINTIQQPAEPSALDNTGHVNSAFSYSIIVPISQLYAARGEDFGIHAFDLKVAGAGVQLAMAAGSDILVTGAGGAPTVNAATTYQVVFHCHEEHYLELKTRHEAVYTPSGNSLTDLELAVKSRLVRFAGLAISAASGGSDMSGITDITSPDYGWSQIPISSLVNKYLLRDVRTGNDPVVSSPIHLVPVVFPGRGQKTSMFRSNPENMPFRLTSTLGTQPYWLAHFVTSRSAAKAAALIRAAGFRNPVALSKGKAVHFDPNTLDGLERYLPVRIYEGR